MYKLFERKYEIVLFLIVWPMFLLSQEEKSSVECKEEVAITKFLSPASYTTTTQEGTQATLPLSRAFQVVMGGVIEYKAKGRKEMDKWVWYLGDGGNDDNSWGLETYPTAGSDYLQKSTSVNKAIIPKSKSPLTVMDFLNSNQNPAAKVKVTRDLGLNTEFSATNDVRVFFNKNELNFHDSSVPNWFYYWKDATIIEGMLHNQGTKFFEVVDDVAILQNEFNEINFPVMYKNDEAGYIWNGLNHTYIYGSGLGSRDWVHFADMDLVLGSNHVCESSPGQNDGWRKVMVDYGDLDFKIYCSDACGYETVLYLYEDINSGRQLGKRVAGSELRIKGIHVFVATILHEMKHMQIAFDFWPNGYDTADDCDTDGYPDSWESGPIGSAWHFDDTKQIYNTKYDSEYLENEMDPATIYEEVVCRNYVYHSVLSILDKYDWSHDPKNEYQGLQWK